ncbi:MAG: methyltransferase [Nitratireductor sp.]
MARDILQGVGIIAIGVAVLIYAMAFRAMQRMRTNILPHRAADHLVTDGPFAFSRNPIYLANFILVTGLGLALANLWLPIAALIAARRTEAGDRARGSASGAQVRQGLA